MLPNHFFWASQMQKTRGAKSEGMQPPGRNSAPRVSAGAPGRSRGAGRAAAPAAHTCGTRGMAHSSSRASLSPCRPHRPGPGSCRSCAGPSRAPGPPCWAGPSPRPRPRPRAAPLPRPGGCAAVRAGASGFCGCGFCGFCGRCGPGGTWPTARGPRPPAASRQAAAQSRAPSNSSICSAVVRF